MMKLQEVTNLLSKQGIQLTATDGKLNIKNDAGKIPSGLQNLIRDREQDLIDWLKHKETGVCQFPSAKENEFPAFATQKALWFSQQRAKPHYIHHAQVKMHIEGQANVPLLIRSLNKLIARRESLRTVLKTTGTGDLVQVVRAPFTVDIPLIIIDSTRDLDTTEKQERIALEQAQARYDLTRGPMFRVSVLQLPRNSASTNRQIILFSFHHIILDDRSWGFLLQEWLMLYEVYICDTLPSLQISAMDYVDYSSWKQEQKSRDKCCRITTLMSAAERHKVVEEWNQTDVAFLETHCVHHLFEEQVRKTPDAVAVSYDDQEVNYYELNRLSNQLAHYLGDLGVRPDARIGLCVERSLDMLVGVLGILKAGGAYVPLDPAAGKERLAYQIKHADIKMLLTQSVFEGQLPDSGQHNLYLDTNAEWVGGEWANKNPISPTEPRNLAYAIYSKAATLRGSVVAVPHSALTNLVQWQATQSNCGKGSKTLLLNSLCSGTCFQEIFSTWCSGGTLVLAPEKRSGNYVSLWRFIDQEGIERLFTQGTVLQLLAKAFQEVIDKNGNNMAPPSLTEVIVSGMPLMITPSIRKVFCHLSKCELVSQYSLLETQVATSFKFNDAAGTWNNAPPIGKPIANSRLYILDKRLRPVPVGVLGEVHIGGAGLAQGYLNQVGLTEARFVSSPFAKKNGEYLYKTGETARFLFNGDVELVS